jgi:hypothetical protein
VKSIITVLLLTLFAVGLHAEVSKKTEIWALCVTNNDGKIVVIERCHPMILSNGISFNFRIDGKDGSAKIEWSDGKAGASVGKATVNGPFGGSLLGNGNAIDHIDGVPILYVMMVEESNSEKPKRGYIINIKRIGAE